MAAYVACMHAHTTSHAACSMVESASQMPFVTNQMSWADCTFGMSNGTHTYMMLAMISSSCTSAFLILHTTILFPFQYVRTTMAGSFTVNQHPPEQSSPLILSLTIDLALTLTLTVTQHSP